MANKDLAKQINDFMKNYRAVQKEANSFEQMHSALGNLLKQSMVGSGSTVKEEVKVEEKKPETKAVEEKAEQNNTFMNNFRDISKEMSGAGGLLKQAMVGDKEIMKSNNSLASLLRQSMVGNSQKEQRPSSSEKEEYEKITATDTPGVNGIIDKEKSPEIPADIKKIEPLKAEEDQGVYSEDDYITYTYKPGDTFGQVIKNLGLNTNAGLWGENGDVAFYTDQLYEQGALDDRGNIPIGTTIRLRKRWATPKNVQLS